jgi:hypothetical protein
VDRNRLNQVGRALAELGTGLTEIGKVRLREQTTR